MSKFAVYRAIAEVPIWVSVEVADGMTSEDEVQLAKDIYNNGDGQEDWSGAEYGKLEFEGYEDD